jgi:hypothetical protein
MRRSARAGGRNKIRIKLTNGKNTGKLPIIGGEK